jgi:DnaK suppressor protein
MNIDIQKYKNILETELKRLESEILEVAEKEGDSTWEAKQLEEEDKSDRVDVANSIETYESNVSIAENLEREIIDIRHALEKIESDAFGTCEICQAEIEEERLDAKPESRTCEAHMN